VVEMNNLTLQEQLSALKPNIINNKEVEHKEDKVRRIFEINKLNEKPVHSNINRNIAVDKINYNNTEIRKPQRREIWNINLGNPIGSLQKGIRPCLVDSNDVNNKYSNIVNVYPLTSSMTKAKIPVHIEIEGYGLKEKSVILVEQGVPIDIRYQLLNYIGTVDHILMKKVDRAREIQHGDLRPKTLLEKIPEQSQKYIINKIKFIYKAKETIKFLKSINGDIYSINLTEDEIFRETNSLQSYCDYNKINYEEILRNYNELFIDKNEDVAM
jgi:mRNA-degrading endonuclease toxin of MazEF toxin-antitoxin module